MVDFYPILLRAVSTPEAGDPRWRREVYLKAEHILLDELHSRRPPASPAEIAAERAALAAAVRRIEAESAWLAAPPGGPEIAPAEPEPERPAAMREIDGRVWIAATVVIAALFAGGYAYWRNHRAPAIAARVTPNPTRPAVNVRTKDGDLPPGVDGTAIVGEQPYVLRRQPTFYRTLQPAGTVVVDKLQHFLYLIEPNNVALRYAIGIGGQCVNVVGPRHVARMAEWPEWEAAPDMVKQKLAKPGIVAGGRGNPLGARVLELDDNVSRINGTNAPQTIGTTVTFGCVRLANDDVIDLYQRVKVGTLVVLN
jgi:lipoprotein-anchoring transpeptidase ErfK/SrfK